MRYLLLLLLLACPLLARPNPDVQLEAIRLVENTTGWGKHGEYGPHQMTRAVRAQVGGHDKAAALRWFNIICARLEENHLEATPWRVAASWNAGVNAVIKDRIPVSTWGYANRVCNVMEALEAWAREKEVRPVRFELTIAPKPRFILP